MAMEMEAETGLINLTNILGSMALLVSSLGVYYANSLRSALMGSDLANVWKYVGIGVFLIFVGALVTGITELFKINIVSGHIVMLAFTIPSVALISYGLKLQLDKVK